MGNPDREFLDAETRIFDADCKPIERVYVDLEYLQDLRLGALINMVTVKEELSYIVHCLPRYNARYDIHTAKYFKALHIDEARIDRVLRRPLAVDKICVTAPFTSIYYELFTIIRAAKNHAQAYTDNPKRIELTISCADVRYPKLLQEKLKESVGTQLDIVVRFEQHPRYSLPDTEYLGYDLLFLYRCGEFVQKHSTAFVGTGKFENKRIVAQPYIEDDRLSDCEDPEYLLSSTERGMDIYCDFNYLRSEIWLSGL